MDPSHVAARGSGDCSGRRTRCLPACSVRGRNTDTRPPTQRDTSPSLASGAAGESGEAGAADALAGLSGEALIAFNCWRLWGFTAVAAAEFSDNRYSEGGVLIGQGLVEVFPTPPPGVDLFDLRAIDKELIIGAPKPDLQRRFAQAQADLIASAPASPETVRRLVEIALGLYRVVHLPEGGVDPIEYQHSLAAVLAAQEALARLKAKANPVAYGRGAGLTG